MHFSPLFSSYSIKKSDCNSHINLSTAKRLGVCAYETHPMMQIQWPEVEASRYIWPFTIYHMIYAADELLVSHICFLSSSFVIIISASITIEGILLAYCCSTST